MNLGGTTKRVFALVPMVLGREHSFIPQIIKKETIAMAKMTPRTLSGFMELLPAPQQQMERIMEVLRRTYSLYGFTPLDTPVYYPPK